MVNETKTFAEYKAPKCRVVGIHVQKALLSVSDPFDSVNNTENFNLESDDDL